MRRLFIDLYLDEDVDVLLATLVRARGFVARTTTGDGRRGTGDEEQLEYAAEQGLTLLTHNRADFEDLARRWIATGRSHAGILVAARRPVHEIARRLLVLLNDVSAVALASPRRAHVPPVLRSARTGGPASANVPPHTRRPRVATLTGDESPTTRPPMTNP